MTTTTPPPSPTTSLSPAVRHGLLAAALLASACDSAEPVTNLVDPERSEPAGWRSTPRSSSTSCGDAIVDPTEQCDDGNLVDDDGCDATCRPSGIAAASAGDGTRCVVTLAGNVKCWGRNEFGQLGRADVVSIGDDERPASIDFVALGGGGMAKEIQTNGEQTFALMADGSVRAWGRNDSYALGLGHATTIGDDETPAEAVVGTVVPLGASILQLAVGGDFACARTDTGTIRCWGANDFGQLGVGTTEPIGDGETPSPWPEVELAGPAHDVTAGAHHACAVLEGGVVQCWGLGRDGQLGYGDTTSIGDDEHPADEGAVDVGGVVVDVEAGGLHTCARLESGSIRCWGDGLAGQLGYADAQSIGDDEAPDAAGDIDLGGVAVDLAAGWAHTCAVLEGGGLRCWGRADWGQLGLGNTATVGDDETPEQQGAVDLGSHGVSAVFIGPMAHSTCVVLGSGSLRCWGHNDVGQLGYGHTEDLGDDPLEGGGDLPDIVLIGDDDDS